MIEFYIGLSSGLKGSLLITVFLMLVTTFIGLRVKKMEVSSVPSGFTLITVNFVDGVNNMLKGFFKVHWKKFAPYLMTILLFLGLANTASLAGFTAPLSNINVALGFSLLAFFSIQFSALFIKRPIQRMKDLAEPHPAFLAINLVGEMSTPFAMGLRLFGNLLSGGIMALMVFGAVDLAADAAVDLLSGLVGDVAGGFIRFIGIGLGVFIHAVFDIFFGLVQAYVYFMLLTIFLSMAVED
jgi:F-type H+-transporting ATPase subunit a